MNERFKAFIECYRRLFGQSGGTEFVDRCNGCQYGREFSMLRVGKVEVVTTQMSPESIP